MKHSRGFLKIVSAAKKKIREVTARSVKTRLKSGDRMTIIDVREEHEWNKARIAGSIHLGRGILERDIEKRIPDKKREIVLYCGGGFRSALAAESLKRMGYRNVFSLRGGWRAWRRIGGPVEKE